MFDLPPAFPSAPVIIINDSLRVGTESTLICQVLDVYPTELLTLTWLRGDTILQSVVGSDSSPVHSEYRFQPVMEDSGAIISCRAMLDLQDLPAENRTRESSITLDPLCEFSECQAAGSEPITEQIFSCIRLLGLDPEVLTQDKRFPGLGADPLASSIWGGLVPFGPDPVGFCSLSLLRC